VSLLWYKTFLVQNVIIIAALLIVDHLFQMSANQSEGTMNRETMLDSDSDVEDEDRKSSSRLSRGGVRPSGSSADLHAQTSTKLQQMQASLVTAEVRGYSRALKCEPASHFV